MASKEERSRFKFSGFINPNTTQVPDELFDLLMPNLTDAELRVLLYIVRRTFGFKKQSDNISLKQMVDGIRTKDGRMLDGGAGLSKAAAARALQGLKEKDIVEAHRNYDPQRGDLPTTYRLHFQDQSPPADEGTEHEGGVSTRETRGVSLERQGGVYQGDTQYTVVQETVRQETVNSNHLEGATLHKTGDSHFSKKRFENFENLDAKIEAQEDRDTDEGDYQPITPSSNGFQSTAQILSNRRNLPSRSAKTDPKAASTPGSGFSNRGRPPKAPEWLARLVKDTSDSLHDHHHFEQNVGQAARLWKQTGCEDEHFARKWSEAKQLSLKRVVDKQCQDHHGLLNRMPYMFKVLRDLYGMKEVLIPLRGDLG